MNRLLQRLRDKGNTVLVVEHKPNVIAIADHVVDLGPGAGAHGGTVCFTGTVGDLRSSGTLTGRHLGYRAALKPDTRKPTGRLEIRNATRHNLRDVSVDIPLGLLCMVTGVAGSGKSSLIHGSMPKGAGVVSIDQTPIRGAATRPPTPGCSTRSGPRSPRPTASSRRCSARTPPAPARTATATASSTPTWR
jgi:excinuclease UvrABC ATPase subunit